MNTLSCIAACLLMAVLLFAVGEAERNCLLEIKSCLTDANIVYKRLIDPTYRKELCSTTRNSVELCLARKRDGCGDLSTMFEGDQSKIVTSLFKAYKQLCSGGGNAAERGPCPQQMKTFGEKLHNCRAELPVDLPEDQNCEPIMKVYDCMKAVEEEKKSCKWFTDPMKLQVTLGINYFWTVGAIKFSCP